MKRTLGALVVVGVLLSVLPAAASVPAESAGEAVTDTAAWLDSIDWDAVTTDAGAGSGPGSPGLRAYLRGESGGDFAAASLSHGARDQWFDECGDADTGARLDLRSTIAAVNGDQFGLLGYTCRAWATPDLGAGSLTWALYVDEYDDRTSRIKTRPSFLVRVFLDGGALKAATYRVAENGIYLTWLTDAQRLDDFAVDAVFPRKAIGGGDSFAFEWGAVDHAGRRDSFPVETDLVPHPDEPDGPRILVELPTFPRGCEESSFSKLGVTPDATSYPRQWSLPAIDASGGWAVRHTSNVRVAVIDDGISAPRRGLAGRVLAGYDAAYEHGLARGRDSDRGGHGTAVSGLLAASGDGGSEVVGVDWGAQLLPVRVTDVNQCISPEAVARGIVWAVDNGAKVINVSLGIPEPDQGEEPTEPTEEIPPPAGAEEPEEPQEPEDPLQAVRDAVDYAFDNDVMVVAGAGNDGGDVQYPAAYPAVLAVGATTRSGSPAVYSARGRQLDVVAPGGNGSGTATADLLTFGEVGQVTPQAGTSFSTALVSGAVALYRAQHPDATVDDLRKAVQSSALDLGTPGHNADSGYGMLNLARLLRQGPYGGPDRGTLPRIAEDRPAEAAVTISNIRFESAGAPHVVLTRHDVFADALAGAALTRQGPLLFTARTVVPEITQTELQRVLRPAGRVYLLGGEKAIGANVANALSADGYDVVRLDGANRYETAVAIGNQVRRLNPQVSTVALARARGRTDTDTAAWADSVTGGAWAARAGVPVLITDTADLHPAAAKALASWKPTRTVLLGGEQALSKTVERKVAKPRRIAGDDRAGTAVAIATGLWTEPRGHVLVNGYRADGWAFGLAAGGLAADRRAPLLLLNRDELPVATGRYLSSVCAQPSTLTLIGSDQIIGGWVESDLVERTSC